MTIELDNDFKHLMFLKNSYVELGDAIITISEDLLLTCSPLYVYVKELGLLLIFLDLSDDSQNQIILASQIIFNYTDLLTSNTGNSFTISGEIDLINGRNLFEIDGLKVYWEDNYFKYNLDSCVEFLESIGNGNGTTLYLSDGKFTTINSYKLYLLETQAYDSLDHLLTVYYNNFGIRTY